MKRIQIEIVDQTAADLAELVKQLNASAGPEAFNSHGPLMVKKLAAMLLEDVGMVVSRPGSGKAPTWPTCCAAMDTRHNSSLFK